MDLEGMKKILKSGYAYVPSGKTIVEGDSVSCQGFFMMKEEVSNFSYREYLFDLKKNNLSEEYKQALPDTVHLSSTVFGKGEFTE